MILSSAVIVLPLISGTINFLVGSMRQADELSMTTVPASANFGAHSRLVLPPALNSAMAGLAAMASVIETTFQLRPLHSIVLPTDFSEATGMSSVTGKFCSFNTSSIFVPTNPVAPTTATFMCKQFGFETKVKSRLMLSLKHESNSTLCRVVGRAGMRRTITMAR